MNFTPIAKRSKSEQRKYYASQRGSWNGLSPVTRVVQSRRLYDRNRIKREDRALLETKSSKAHQRSKDRNRLRRIHEIQKSDRLLRIINYGGYAPHRGYIDWGFDGQTLLHSGKHIKYPKNSNCQRWIKRETSRKIRNCRSTPVKGNFYRRLFDYWWTLY